MRQVIEKACVMPFRRVQGGPAIESWKQPTADEAGRAISRHPSIKLCVTITLSDPIFDARACACVVLEPGINLTGQAVLTYARSQGVTEASMPELVEFFDELPLSADGTVSDATLRVIVAERMLRKVRERLQSTCTDEPELP